MLGIIDCGTCKGGQGSVTGIRASDNLRQVASLNGPEGVGTQGPCSDLGKTGCHQTGLTGRRTGPKPAIAGLGLKSEQALFR